MKARFNAAWRETIRRAEWTTFDTRARTYSPALVASKALVVGANNGGRGSADKDDPTSPRFCYILLPSPPSVFSRDRCVSDASRFHYGLPPRGLSSLALAYLSGSITHRERGRWGRGGMWKRSAEIFSCECRFIPASLEKRPDFHKRYHSLFY